VSDHPASAAPAETTTAAGTICWRPGRSGDRYGTGLPIEIAIVHRPHHRDWSLPKGKPETGETLPVCAVRETREETGAEVTLGPALPTQEYQLPDGRTKRVVFWTARVVRVGPRTAPAEEIDEVRWVSPATATQTLSYDTDRELVASLTDTYCPDCYPIIVIRHVAARPRDTWPRADADRPLVSSGKRQARSLATMLNCWRPEYLLTSPWKRCVDTLRPYQHESGLKVRTKDGLSEDGNRRDPGKARKHAEKLLHRGQPSALCTHRPVLPRVLDTLRRHSGPEVSSDLPEQDPFLDTGEILVLHTRRDQDGPRVVAAERHGGHRLEPRTQAGNESP
jgi:8-oxo-dGTP diphosphatase